MPLSLGAQGRSRRRGHYASPVTEVQLPATEQGLYLLHEGIGRLEKALPPPRDFRTIIFGSARVKRDDPHYRDAYELAQKLAERGIEIVTGGGPGIMEAANRGAHESGPKHGHIMSWGVCIDSVYGRIEPPNAYLSRAYQHGNFFTRLHQFARLGASGAFVVLPGGIGTLLELAIIWQLLQVGHLKNCPLIVADPMWHDVVDTVRQHAVPRGYVRDEEIERNVVLVSSAREALPIILDAHGRFKKMRAAG